MSNPNIYQPEAPQKSGCGGPCLKSCLGVAIVLVVLMIVAVVGLYWGAGRMVDAFLDTEPMELPEVQLSPAEKQDLENRIASFEETLEQPGELATLRLTGDEINAFVRDQLQDEELGRFSEYIYVTIEDGTANLNRQKDSSRPHRHLFRQQQQPQGSTRRGSIQHP